MLKMFKRKDNSTVASVYSEFTEKFETVIEIQSFKASTAKEAQLYLKTQLALREGEEGAASIEVVQARNAIKGIGEMLGITAS